MLHRTTRRRLQQGETIRLLIVDGNKRIHSWLHRLFGLVDDIQGVTVAFDARASSRSPPKSARMCRRWM